MTIKTYNGSQLLTQHKYVKHITTSTSLCGNRKLILTYGDGTQEIINVKAWEIFGIWED